MKFKSDLTFEHELSIHVLFILKKKTKLLVVINTLMIIFRFQEPINLELVITYYNWMSLNLFKYISTIQYKHALEYNFYI